MIIFSDGIIIIYPNPAPCEIATFKSLSLSKPLAHLLPGMFSVKTTNKNNYVIGTKPDGKEVTLPMTYFEMETAMGVEAEYGQDGGKIVLIIQPGQSALSRT